MAVNRQPVLKRCRSLGIEPAYLGIYKKSKKQPPRQMRKMSEYGAQLREKQKAKFIYGVLEKQFRNYFAKASKMRGVVGENLLALLETRVDNTLFRLGFARTRREARQIVSHNSILINGKRVNIASYNLKAGDVITVTESARQSQRFKDILAATSSVIVPAWLSADKDRLQGTVVSIPTREMIDLPVHETLIVELYSK
ncbi:MAG: 30S ribosomal protein S4 [Defluviitaleaceae bacterium]|nr:30S ribosomal protein S4 [Defluviitaleaceae bacterium]